MLAAGLAGTVLAGLLGVGGGNPEVLAGESKVASPQAAGESTSKVPSPGSESSRTTLRGRVVGPDGKPVAGATVTAARYRRAAIGTDYWGTFTWEPTRQEMDRSAADADGQFRLSVERFDPDMDQDPESPNRWQMAIVVARAPGFGPAWEGASDQVIQVAEPLRLVPDDVPVTGRVVDLEGRPVAGAIVRVDGLGAVQSADEFERWVKTISEPTGGKDRPPLQGPPPYSRIPGRELGLPGPVTTGTDGRFRLTGLGRDRLAWLSVSGPTVALRRITVITRRIPRVEGPPRSPEERNLDDRGFYGADCTIVTEPGRPIEGVVRDAVTKAPLPGAIVTAMQLAGSLMGIEGIITAVTDAQGRYRLLGLPKASGHRLSVYPALEHPYFFTQFLTVPAGPGLGPVRFDIDLKRGLFITGRVTDAQTGRPVQAAIHYYPYLANDHAKDYPNFNPNSLSVYWTGTRYCTDADGRFRVVALAGRGILAAKSFDRSYRLGIGAETIPEKPGPQAGRSRGLPTYNQMNPGEFQAVAVVDPPANAVEFRQDLALQPGPSLSVQVVDPAGKPLEGVAAWGRFPAHLDYGDHNLYHQTRTRVIGLDPTISRTVVFRHHGRKLGAVLVVTTDEAARGGERTVTLRPCATVTGRIVDAEGKPLSGGVQIRLAHGAGDRSDEVWLPGESIHEDGRFRIEDLAPGGTYHLQARNRLYYGMKMEPERFQPFDVARDLVAEPGRVIDLGTFNAATGRRIEAPEPEKPARTVPRGQ
jgi:protocatechuate 3,4-dioxygenase beta subunit